MLNPESLSETLLFTTVRIEATSAGGALSVGTGFFFNHVLDDQRTTAPLIITNKHVVAGAESGRFFVHEALGAGDSAAPADGSVEIRLDAFQTKWIPHPAPEVDLCAIPFQPLVAEMAKRGKGLFWRALGQNLIPTDEQLSRLNAIENVVMVGYPIGLWDDANNLPLIRRGVTATHPAVDFRGKPHGVIDAACFPGSSGSPVLVLDEGFFFDRNGTYTGASRAVLLGVLFAGPQMTAQGEIVVEPVPTAAYPVSQTRVMIHLGYIVKAKEIRVLGAEVVRLFNLAAK